jgi:hypothetical protein
MRKPGLQADVPADQEPLRAIGKVEERHEDERARPRTIRHPRTSRSVLFFQTVRQCSLRKGA